MEIVSLLMSGSFDVRTKVQCVISISGHVLNALMGKAHTDTLTCNPSSAWPSGHGSLAGLAHWTQQQRPSSRSMCL